MKHKLSELSPHSFFRGYCKPRRWMSFWHQIDTVLRLQPGKILEIGVGVHVLEAYIKTNTNLVYTSMDIDPERAPDVEGNVVDIPLLDNEYDVICAFQVLEHLPFGDFSRALKEMRRVAKKNVVISLPHHGRQFYLKGKLPFIRPFTWKYFYAFFPSQHTYDGAHYWEIGKKGYSLERVKKEIEITGLVIEEDFQPDESPRHHFFVLKVR